MRAPSPPCVVLAFFEGLLGVGAKNYYPPEDTKMYESMKFTCVDDPFGVRIDIYCPIQAQEQRSEGA